MAGEAIAFREVRGRIHCLAVTNHFVTEPGICHGVDRDSQGMVGETITWMLQKGFIDSVEKIPTIRIHGWPGEM